jgi:hypothetical protein
MKQKGYNKDADIMLGIIKQPLPDLLVKLERSGLELDKTDFIVSETVSTKLAVNDRVIIARDGDIFFILDKAVIL